MGRHRVLVTGANGFVGAVLSRRLLADGHELHVLLRGGPNWRLAEVAADLRVHAVDLRDATAVAGAVGTIKPDVVYHLAAHGAYPFQTDGDAILRTNILGTWNLLHALQSVYYRVFVNAGSSSEYGFKQVPMRETDRPEPNSIYAVAKCAQTMLCAHVAQAEDRPICTLRLFSVYGPFEEPSRLVPTVVRRCLRGEALELAQPDLARDFVFVDDVVDAFLRVERLASLRGDVINICTGVQRTIKEVVDLVLAQTGAAVECRWGAMAPRNWDQTTWVGVCERARQRLGWTAATSLAEGLARTIAWQRARPGGGGAVE
jgi:nucleoside-diphosphate-sugar epimerase